MSYELAFHLGDFKELTDLLMQLVMVALPFCYANIPIVYGRLLRIPFSVFDKLFDV